jgi:hypothetical protein
MEIAKRILSYILVHVLAFLLGVVGLWLAHSLWTTGIVARKPPLDVFVQMFSFDHVSNFALLWPLHVFAALTQVGVRLALKRRQAVWCCAIVCVACFVYQALMIQLALGNLDF